MPADRTRSTTAAEKSVPMAFHPSFSAALTKNAEPQPKSRKRAPSLGGLYSGRTNPSHGAGSRDGRPPVSSTGAA